MHYVVLNHWGIFQTDLTKLRGVMAKNQSKSTQKLYFLLVGKRLKIHNLPTTNATSMKRTKIMHLFEIFYSAKN